ncbi:MAG TPA: Hsp20/alpha crystallin family protein [Clostridiales bacterium]|nr:Hsp20/alpha crystallin family protein [Clostridiales bacterium]
MFGLTPYNRRNTDVERQRDSFSADSWVDNFFKSFFDPFQYGNQGRMKVDIKENDKDYVIEADLPGVNKDDVQIELRNDILTIGVKQNEVKEEERDNYICKERRTSSMSRSFKVDNVEAKDIKAKFDNGVLAITLPKSEKEKKNQYRIDIH